MTLLLLEIDRQRARGERRGESAVEAARQHRKAPRSVPARQLNLMNPGTKRGGHSVTGSRGSEEHHVLGALDEGEAGEYHALLARSADSEVEIVLIERLNRGE